MERKEKQSTDDIAIGIYLHVPFCASTCDFCAFYQEKPQRQELERYLAGVASELRQAQCAEPVDTIFWGGGTPGLLPARDLERLGQATLDNLHFVAHEGGSGPIEWTVEMAPSTVKADKIKLLKDIGVTRISMGVQSFDADLLSALGRQHSPKQVYKAYDTLRESGFENVNLDLMFAIPGQTQESWQSDLDAAIALEPEHLSTYCLTFEEDTKLWVKLARGELKRDVELEADLYRFTWDYLQRAGYAQYEVSNFARPGRACLHNLNTWQMKQWRGFGPSAASQHSGRRFSNPSSLDEWLQGVEQGQPHYVDESELTEELLAVDSLIFGLRMNAGVDLATLQKRFPAFEFQALEDYWTSLEPEGYFTRSGSQLKLTDAGRMVVDAIGSDLLERF